jgi:hypothetical protein
MRKSHFTVHSPDDHIAGHDVLVAEGTHEHRPSRVRVVLVFGGAPPCVDVKRVRLTVRLWTVN